MKNNEFQLYLEEYLTYDIKTSVLAAKESEESANAFFLNLNRIVFRDNPDAYIKNGNVIYIIEHFEYDVTLRK